MNYPRSTDSHSDFPQFFCLVKFITKIIKDFEFLQRVITVNILHVCVNLYLSPIVHVLITRSSKTFLLPVLSYISYIYLSMF